MSTEGIHKITPEVSMDSKIFYLIRFDKAEMAFCDSEEEAIIAVSSLANSEIKTLENEWTKVFRQDLEGGKKVIISTQELGNIYNGSILEKLVIDIIPVGHAFLTKGILEMPQKQVDCEPVITSVPVPDILQRLAQLGNEEEDEKVKETDEESDSEGKSDSE